MPEIDRDPMLSCRLNFWRLLVAMLITTPMPSIAREIQVQQERPQAGGVVRQFDRGEWKISLPREYRNPFDPNEIAVDANFSGPGGSAFAVPCFWTRDRGGAAAETGQFAARAVDGSADGYPGDYTREWATVQGGAGSWIELSWTSAETLDHIVLCDRPNTDDQVTAATLTFSNGNRIDIGSLPNAGAPTSISFPAVTTTSVVLTITGVSSTTINVGLSEFEAWTAGPSNS